MEKKSTITTNPEEMPLSPEEIKAIGEIELGPAKHEIFLNKHYKKLIIGGIAFMVAASAGIGYYSYKNEMNQQAAALVVDAMKTATPSGAVEPSAYDAASLARISSEYPDTPSAETAVLMEALSLMSDSAKAETGAAQLEGLAAQTQNELVRARALSALAAYYMSEGQNEKASGYWQQITSLPVNPYTAIAYISLGDIAKEGGDIEAARNYYNQVTAVCPYSSIVREQVAGIRLSLLDVDAPKPVENPAPQQLAPAAPATTAPAAGSTLFGIDTSNPFGTMPSAPAGSTMPATPTTIPAAPSTVPAQPAPWDAAETPAAPSAPAAPAVTDEPLPWDIEEPAPAETPAPVEA